jgi:hypothetical protein
VLQKNREQLLTFLAPAMTGGSCGLYLPRFTDARIELGSASSKLRYPGGVFADRDTKAAMQVIGLVANVVGPERVRIQDAHELMGLQKFPGGFLFGSKSNPAMSLFETWFGSETAFNFEFDDDWTIVWEHGDRYSMRDPSRLGRDEYSSQTDYGIVARLTSSKSRKTAFVLAGLGGRATEGCGIYLAKNWKRLFDKYGKSDFCVLLKFSPPLDPTKSSVIREKEIRSTRGSSRPRRASSV